MEYSEDLLLKVTGSAQEYRMFQPPPLNSDRQLERSLSFDNLVHELFNNSNNQPEPMDIQQEFDNESKRAEEPLWQPQSVTSSKSMDKESSNVSQPVSSGITNMAQTLECPATLRMTQEPRHPIPDPERVGSDMPVLPVFKSCPPRQLPLLETVDPDTVEEILSPLSAVSGTEVTQAAQMPQMEMQAKYQVTVPVSESLSLSVASFSIAPRPASPDSEFATSSSATSAASSAERRSLSEKVLFIKKAVDKYHKKGGATCSNGKIQVHEVVLVILQARHRLGFNKVLCFCTEDGTETAEVSENFMSRDTKLMGLIWQSLKGNRNANYDTFARAMRVGRERNKDYFDYLSGGKASKKRVYKLGPKALKEFNRMRGIFVDE